MQKMKKGFTLVELLVVVTVISILMAMVMRFGNVTSASTARHRTIDRLQRLENALSGYYAAYGTYPPVRVHGTRDIYRAVNWRGVQSESRDDRNEDLWGWVDQEGKVTDENKMASAWKQVKPACEAQPVICNFPYSDKYQEKVRLVSEALKALVQAMPEDAVKPEQRAMILKGFDAGSPDRFGGEQRKLDKWTSIQLFRFGLMSFLLPRYKFMMEANREYLQFSQWTENNRMVSNPLTCETYDWDDMKNDVDNAAKSTSSGSASQSISVDTIMSQAQCGRWLPNFQNMLASNDRWRFYGVDILSSDESDNKTDCRLRESNLKIKIYTPGGYRDGSNAGQYVLNAISVCDGWGNDFFYYSPEPYQGYVVWSAGPNGMTFPPWVSIDALSDDAKRCVRHWTSDDIVGLRN